MLQGRRVERELLAALVETARSDQSGAVLVLGEPGIGKSALLDDVAEVAVSADVRVMRTQGLQQEAPLAFGSLHRLLRPLHSFLDRIPEPQGRGLRLAFGMESGESVDPFLVGVATLSLLSSAAEESTLACLVDDAHWLDDASAEALLFAARRLQADRVAMVFAAREPHEPSFAPEGIPVVRLSGLDDADARAVLNEVHGREPLDADVVDRLLAAAGGNPLALRSLPTALSTEQLTGRSPLPEQLAPGEGLQRVLLQQMRRLPRAAQTLLLVAACDDVSELAITRAAAARLGVDGGWDVAENSGLLVVTESAVRISHPLVRSAVSGAATSTQRRAAHQALADAFLDAGDAARGVWHSAAASSGYDEVLASALAELATRAADRGGLGLAADAYERAAELTGDPDRRARWSLAAAAHAWAAGQGARASRLAGRAREDSIRSGGADGQDPLLRADIDRLRGRIEVNTGSASKGQAIFVTAALAVAPHDPGRALDMAVAAALMRAYGIDSGVDLPERLVPTDVVAADVPRTACLKLLLETMGHANRGEWWHARLALDRALRYADSLSRDARDLDVWGNLGNAALAVGDEPAAHRCYTAMHAHALDAGSGMSVVYALHRIGFAQITAGQWGPIRAHAEDALALARSIGQPALTVTPVAWLTWLAALQGDAAYTELRGRLDGLTRAHPLGILAGPVRDLALWADGAHAATDGDHGQALHHLARIQVPALRRMSALDRIDAAVRAGETLRAELWIDEVDRFGELAGWAWPHAVAEYGRGLLAEKDASAGERFRQALGVGPASRGEGSHSSPDEDSGEPSHPRPAAPRPFEHARIQLAYGQWLRRGQQRIEARTQLRAALETFADLEAVTWAARAAEELRASGESARKRNPSTLLQLTPMERKIADLVATGLSNKSVAAQCWISPRTVAFHLRNVFAKTGVTSRGELIQLVAATN